MTGGFLAFNASDGAIHRGRCDGRWPVRRLVAVQMVSDRRRRPRPSTAIPEVSTHFVCCQTGGSPPAPSMGRFGCGMPVLVRGYRTPAALPLCQRSLPADGRAARFGLWDRRSGCGTSRPAPRPRASKGHARSVTRSLPARGRTAGLGLDDKTIRLWDVKTGAETARLKGSRILSSLFVPAAERAARLGFWTRRSDCGTSRPAPRPRASKDTPTR